MKISLNKALKLKKKLASELAREKNKLNHNSYHKDNTPRYNTTEVLDNILKLHKKLIDLKTIINTANSGIINKIFELEETKSYLVAIKSIPTREGVSISTYSGAKEEYVCTLNESDINNLEEKTIQLIDNLQDEIDAYNATTFIEIN